MPYALLIIAHMYHNSLKWGSDNKNKEWNEKQNVEWNGTAESLMVEYYYSIL